MHTMEAFLKNLILSHFLNLKHFLGCRLSSLRIKKLMHRFFCLSFLLEKGMARLKNGFFADIFGWAYQSDLIN